MRIRLLWVVVVSLSIGSAAAAQPDPAATDATNKAAAQALFDDGRRLMDEGRHKEACAAFAESQRLDPALGTRFKLAECLERLGKIASAWVHYVGVTDAAERAGQTDRGELARARATALEPRLPKLRVVVSEVHPNLGVRRNGTEIGPAQWSKDVPIDPGSYEISARAPGRKDWSTRIDVTEEGSVVSVTVPPLAPAPPPPPRAAPRPGPRREGPADAGLGAQRTGALVAGAAGLAGIGVGVAFGLVAMSKKSDANRECPEAEACFPDGRDLIDEARTAGDVATVALAAGGAALVGGVILWLTAPSAHRTASGAPLRAPPLLSARW